MLRIAILLTTALLLTACANGPGISKADEGADAWPSIANPAPLYL